MSRIFTILTAFFLLSIYAAKAQQGFHFGINGSVINSYLVDTKLYGDVDYRPNFTYGPLFGIAAGNNFTDQFGLEIEVNYARLGQAYEYNDSLNQVAGVYSKKGKVTLDYYQVPVFLKLTGGEFKTRFSAMLGPQFSFLANAWNRETENGEAVKAKKDFNSMDIGLALSAGSDITLTEDLYLNLGLRFYYSLTQANENKYIISPTIFRQSRQLQDNLANAYGGVNVGIHYLIRNNKAMEKQNKQ